MDQWLHAGDIGLTTVLYIYKTAFTQFDSGYASALSVLLFICLVLINLIYVKLLKIGKRRKPGNEKA